MSKGKRLTMAEWAADLQRLTDEQRKTVAGGLSSYEIVQLIGLDRSSVTYKLSHYGVPNGYWEFVGRRRGVRVDGGGCAIPVYRLTVKGSERVRNGERVL